MRALLATILLMVASTGVVGKVYVVSPTGNDSNAGTTNSPFLTQQKAWNVMQPGDVTYVMAGNYTRVHNWDQTVTNGLPGFPIQMIAVGGVTNAYGERIANSFNLWQGFSMDGLSNQPPTFNMPGNTGAYAVEFNSLDASHPISNSIVANISQYHLQSIGGFTITGPDAFVKPITGTSWGSNGPVGCVISNCSIIRYTNCQAVTMGGMSNSCLNSTFEFGSGADLCFLFGLSNRFAGNFHYFTEVGTGFHPDCFQAFCTSGSSGGGAIVQNNTENYGNIIENNYLNQMDGGLCEFEFYPNPTNVIPHYGYYVFRNNIFANINQCSVNFPGFSWLNNTFYNCYGIGMELYALTNWSRVAEDTFPGCATNTTIFGNLFLNSGTYNVQYDTNANYPVNIFADWNAYCFTNGAGGWSTYYHIRQTNFFSVGGIGLYNVQGVYDTAGTCITNGQDPKLVGVSVFTNQWDLRPMLGSALIDAGTNATGSDFEGWSRPKGATNDIGAYEFDPNLKLFMFQAYKNLVPGKVDDISGSGNDGWNFQGTNWIYTTNGPIVNGTFSDFAGFWYTNGVMTNDPPFTYNLSTYVGVTNLNGIRVMTNATISVWGQISQNQDYPMRFLGNGFNANFAKSSVGSSNSWDLGRDYQAQFNFIFYPASGGIQDILTFPDNTIQSQGAQSNVNLGTLTYHMYTASIDCTLTTNNIIGFLDGVPFQTNTLNAKNIQIYGTDPQRWLGIGTMTHDGTPQWGDDAYPNDGFYQGKMADLRIYNRTLSPSEIAGPLFQSGALLPLAPVSDPAITIQPANQTVTAPATATFSVTATGTAPLTYQWSKNSVSIGGATSSSYTTPPTTTGNNGDQYFCAVTSAVGGPLNSSTATLTVNAAATTGSAVGLGSGSTLKLGSGSTVILGP